MIATQSIATVLAALLFSLVVPLFGYVYLGPLYGLLFLTGYLGGFMLWLLLPGRADWRAAASAALGSGDHDALAR